MRKLHLTSLLLLVVLVSCATEPERPARRNIQTSAYKKAIPWGKFLAEEVEGYQDHFYYEGFQVSQYPRLTFDYYRPQGVDQRLPLIVFAHPGAFFLFDKKEYIITKYCKEFSRAGFATASINYRLIGQSGEDIQSLISKKYTRGRIMEAVGDLRAALNYFISHADELNIDPNRIVFVGFSAGGIMGCHLLFSDREEILEYTNGKYIDNEMFFDVAGSSLVRGVISISGGILDYSHIDDTDLGQSRLLMIHGTQDGIVPIGLDRPFNKYVKDTEFDLPALRYELSIRNVRTQDSLIIKGLQPEIFIPGWAPDLIVNAFTSDVCGSACIVESLGNKNTKVELKEVRGGDHSFMIDSEGRFNMAHEKTIEIMYNFVISVVGNPI